MSAGVVTFVYSNGGFLRIPREELRGAQHPVVVSNYGNEHKVCIEFMLSTIAVTSLQVTIGIVYKRSRGFDRDDAEEIQVLEGVRAAMLMDLGATIDIDVTWIQTASGPWKRSEGRPT